MEDLNLYQLGRVLEKHINSYSLIKVIKEVVVYHQQLHDLRQAYKNSKSVAHKELIEDDMLKVRRYLVSRERLMMRLLNGANSRP